jgi:tRNA-modifying protein YgfZ
MAEAHASYHPTHPAAVLRAAGPDAFAFLQSQFSNDLRHPGVENPATYGLWLDHKGKIQADSFVLQRGPEEFLLVSYDCPAGFIRAHLEAHLVADEVELSDVTGEFGLLHVWPEKPGQEVQSLAEARDGSRILICWPGRRPMREGSWDFLADERTLETFAKTLVSHGAEAVSAEELQAARIIAGVPAVPLDAGAGDLPQEAGLDRDAVSFNKGCYTGQEVMSRLHSQGHVNRALWQVSWESGAPELSGAGPIPLFAGDTQAGELRSRATQNGRGIESGIGRSIGIAMLKRRVIAERQQLSFSSGGPEVVELGRGLVNP